MDKKNSFMRQFKRGYVPQEHADESTRVNGPEISSPSKMHRRSGIAIGSQTEAFPGLARKNDYSKKKKKSRK